MVIAIIILVPLVFGVVFGVYFLLCKFQDYCQDRKYERERSYYGDDSDEGHGAHFW